MRYGEARRRSKERKWKTVYSFVSSLGRTQHTLKGHSGPVSRQREVQETGQAHFLWFPQEEKGEAEQAGLGLANVSNFSRLWDKGAAPSCLVPGLEAMGWVHSGLQCENPIRDIADCS